MGSDTSEVARWLNEMLRADLVGTRQGGVEVMGAYVEAVTISEADEGPPYAKLEITVVLHTTNSGAGWDVEDVLTIRRLVGTLTATVEMPSSVRFVPDDDDPSQYEPDDEPLSV
jgi:hypothetical protein